MTNKPSCAKMTNQLSADIFLVRKGNLQVVLFWGIGLKKFKKDEHLARHITGTTNV
jgi:hypothetical protein